MLRNCYSDFDGTNREYFDLCPNDFLKYEIIKWAKEKGLKNFVLGCGYGADDGIFQCKTCLAPKEIVDFFIGHKVFDNKMYKALVDIRSENNMSIANTKFFPAYRAGGLISILLYCVMSLFVFMQERRAA